MVLWDLTTGRRRAVLDGHEEDVSEAFFSPDGRLLVSSDVNGTVKVWDVPAQP